ncbi:MAG TPA: hypothetical protein VKM55_20285 [Candidatus Lokiarchaeia archaeon]|nr:hypothetical protein [Candidatus Lokiarchaeia archaeon]
MEINPDYLNVLLSSEDIQILKAINYGLSDVQSIHLLTGIPTPCIERRMRAYLDFNFVGETMNGYVLNGDNEAILSYIRARPARA